MSKYVRKDLFNKFKEQVQQESSQKANQGPSNRWPNPPVGEYKLRFLPDKSGNNLYKKYYYHMFQVGDRWQFSLCPKTFDFEAFCPLCAVTAKLYKTGNDADKKEAGRFKRKEKFVTNAFIVSDPRDVDKDEEQKQAGKVKLYEFGTKLEQQIRTAVMDTDDGVGQAAFDPSDEGVNFILRVTETKPGPDGKKWADFSTSSFARNSSAIADTEKEIDAIMDQTYDIDEYLEKMKPSEEDIIEQIKEEQVYDLIAEDYERILRKRGKGISVVKKEETVVVEDDTDEVLEVTVTPNPAKPVEKEESKNSDDEELLAELSNL